MTKVTPKRPGREAFRASLLAVYVLACCAVLFLPLSIAPSRHLPDEGDALQATWMMAWVAHRLPSAPTRLFDANVYFPHPDGLAYSEHFLPQGLVVGLFQLLGANLVLAYNLLVAGTFATIAVAVYLLARDLGLEEMGAAIAAAVAALSAFNLGEISRLHILFMPALPLAVLFLRRFFRTGSWGASIGFAVSFLVQGFASHYYLISLPLFLGAWGLALLRWHPERRRARELVKLVLPLLFAGVLFLPVELVYLETFRSYRFEQPLPEGTDLGRYLVPPFESLLYGWIGVHSAALRGANEHFVGLAPLALAGIGLLSFGTLRPDDRRALRALTAMGVVFAALSTGSWGYFFGRYLGPGPYQFLYKHVPFFNLARVPERLSVYFALSFALVAGVGGSALARRLGGRKRWFALALLLLLLPLEQARVPLRPYPRIPTPSEIPEVYRWLQSVPGDFPVVELPVYPRRQLRLSGYEDYFSTFHWKRIFFGRPSFYPPALEYLLWSFRNFPDPGSVRILQSLGVSTVVYHPLRDPAVADETLRRLDRDRRFDRLQEFGPAAAAAEALGYGGEVVFSLRSEAMPPEATRGGETPISAKGFRFETSSESDPRAAVDGELSTSWSSLSPQFKGQFFDVDLGGEYLVSRISLGFVYPYSEFPRELAVNGYHSSHRWERLVLEPDEWAGARLVEHLVRDPATATIDLVLDEPRLLQRVRLFLQRTVTGDDLPEWKIPEIRIYQIEAEGQTR